ncbi:MAG TPA: glucose-6-phosphate dehydrogenase assembly protein OpcA [Acidobacteriota bacterium]
MSELDIAGAQPIDIQRADRELRSIWGGLAHSGEQSAEPVLRACALTLLVYLSDRSRLPEVSAALDQVAQFCPNRSILLLDDDTAPENELSAYAKLLCFLSSQSRRKLCGEQIILHAGPGRRSVLHSAAHPLIIPDIPMFLWWNHHPDFDHPTFQKLTNVADRLIVDSDLFNRVDFDKLVEFVSRRSRPIDLAVSDLNWGRLSRWRAVLAQFYDSRLYRSHLQNLISVDIEYFTSQAARDSRKSGVLPFPVRPLLLIAWLASRLGWKPLGEILKDGNRYEAGFSAAGRKVTVSVTLSPVEGEQSAVGSIGLNTSDGATFVAERASFGSFAQASVTLPGLPTMTRTTKLSKLDLPEILRGELELLDRDRVYEETLLMASYLA